jgi:hypothetical protein
MKKRLTLSDAIRAIEAAGFRPDGDLVSVDYRLSPWSAGIFVTCYPGDRSDGDRGIVSFAVDEKYNVRTPNQFTANLAEAVERYKALACSPTVPASSFCRLDEVVHAGSPQG